MSPINQKKPTLLSLYFQTSAKSTPHRLLRKFIQAASWFDADLHLLLQPHLRKKLEIHLRKLHSLSNRRPVVDHLLHENYFRETMNAVTTLSADYLCFEDGGVGHSRSHLARLKQSLLAQSTIPVLILPKRLPETLTRFDSIIVPISGEQRNSEALRRALKIAHATRTAVTLAHVSQSGRTCSCEGSGLESIGDEIQHEYARHLDKTVSEASPNSSFKERQYVTCFAHLSGATHSAISRLLKQSPRSLLVLEWKGILIEGHAATLRALLKTTHAPILIVKMAQEAHSKLKIDREFKAA